MRSAGSKLPMVLPRNATVRDPSAGQQVQLVGEIRPQRADVQLGVRRDESSAGGTQRVLADVECDIGRLVGGASEVLGRMAARRAAVGSSPTIRSRVRSACRGRPPR